ncbi:MAG: LamG domain-containing protein [Victivallaceae bacterium]
MKLLTAILAALCLAWNVGAADAVMYFDFEAPPGVPGKNLSSNDGNSFGRFRENTKTKQTAQIAADTPDALKSRSQSCAEVNRGLIWLKPNGKAPYEFATGFTFNLWFKADDAPDKTVFFGSFNKSWRLGYTPSNQRFYFQNQANAEREYSTPIPFPAGAWHMLTVTGKDGEINFFLDGKAAGSRRLKQPFAASQELFLGNGAAFDDSCFDGRIDDVALYDAMLNQDEIAKLFTGAPVTVKRTAPASSVNRAPGTLERIKTEPFGPDFKPYAVVRELALVKDGKPAAVIVKADAGEFAGQEGKLQDALEGRWKVRFPVMGAAAALKSGMPLILFGRANSNMLLRRLDVNGCIEHTQKGYEVRVMPQALDWPSGVVFIGGKDETAMLKGVEVLTSKFADPGKLGFFIELEDFRNHRADPAAVGKMVEAMTGHYKNPPDYIPNQSAIRVFREPSALFRRTGDPAYARALGDQLKIYLDNYDKAINARNTPPSFMLHEMPWLFALVENSPAFTDQDRARFAEVLRRAAEHCMNYWEMRDPMANYEAGKTVYYTNHPIFASRSVWFAGNYLWTHYRYKPAEYWMRVAENALAGIAPHPLGPEDSASYQFICYRLFLTYAIGSGKYDAAFFNSKPFLNYIEYCKALMSHLGAPAGYGDNPAMGNPGGFPILGYAVDLFADREAESLLALIGRDGGNPTYRSMIENMGIDLATPPAMKDSTVGLKVYLLDEFRMDLRKTPEKNTDAIDKIYFRSSWQPDAGFLVLSGISAAPHGHQGANGISLYLRGSHYWLVEGDYIRLQPEEHNSIALRVNGEAVRPGEKSPDSLARLQFAGELPDRSMALSVSKVPAYGKAVDWRRMIAWEKDAGFWVVDDLQAIAAAEVAAENRFRSLADAIEVSGQTVALTQKQSKIANDPDRFFITEGAGAEQRLTSQFDAGHSGKDGYYLGQKFASPLTRVIKQRQSGLLKKGDSLRFANYLGHEPVMMRELAPGAYLAMAGGSDGPVRLALTGPCRAAGVEFDGESCFAGPR